MSDTLESFYLKKLNKLDKFVVNPENNRSAVIKEIRTIKVWLQNNRSLVQHRTLQAYFHYLYLRHGQVAHTKESFVIDIKKNIGFVTYNDSEIFYTDKGERKTMIMRQPKVQSLSFADCSQTLFREVFEKVKIYAWYEYKDDFDAWFDHWYRNENTTQ